MSRHAALEAFRAGYAFDLDPFQAEACLALEDGYSVLVCAPTGAGKTVPGEFAVHLALALGQKCFYTTPIKALSNQKYNDLVERHGNDKDVDAQLLRYVGDRRRQFEPVPGGRRHGPRGWRPTPRPDVITRLDDGGLLPAITFIFSRAGCDAAVKQCVWAGMWLTDEDERATIDAVIEERTADIPPEDLDVLGFWEWRDGLRRGL